MVLSWMGLPKSTGYRGGGGGRIETSGGGYPGKRG